MKRVTLGLCLLAIWSAPAIDAATQRTAADERAVLQVVEQFLSALGNREADKLPSFFTPKALFIVVRQQPDGTFKPSYQTGEEWLAAFSPAGAKFQEPIANARVTIDSGHLAHVRADFQVVRDGKTLSSGVDQFTLVRENGVWKIAVAAYTSLPAKPSGPQARSDTNQPRALPLISR